MGWDAMRRPTVVGTQERVERTFHSTVHIYPGAQESTVSLFSYVQGDDVPRVGAGLPARATSLDTNAYAAGYMPSDVSFAVLSWEVRVVEGRSDPELSSALEQIQLSLVRSSRPEVSAVAAAITVTDSVLEARVKRLEEVLDALVGGDEGLDPGQLRLRATLKKLGWKPYDAPDYRRLITPILIGGTERYAVEMEIPEGLPTERRLVLRVMLRGLLTRALL